MELSFYWILTVSEFFSNLRSVFEKHLFGPESIFNLDKTGVTIVQKPGKVFAERGEKQVSKVTSTERGTLVTLCCSVSAVGTAVPPFFIYPRLRINDRMNEGAPVGSCVAASPSGWMTGETFELYWDHFVKHTKCSKQHPALVILDNHESHIKPKSLQKCKDNGITLVTLPPHTSHRLQPLDRSVFGPFKSAYNVAVDDFMATHPAEPVIIYHIPRLVGVAFPLAFIPTNIMSGFKCTGIWPFNSNIFTAADFMCSYVTDRSPGTPTTAVDLPAISSPSGSSSRVQTDDQPSTTPTCRPITKPIATGISPEEVRPFPKAGPRKSQGGRKRVVSRVVTDTPVKSAIELEHEQHQQKKRKTSFAPTKSICRKIFTTENEDESEEDTYFKDVSDEVKDWGVNSVEIGDFVLVWFATKTNICHYVGKVIETNDDGDDECKIKSLCRYKSEFFVYPDIDDISFVPFGDIQKLPCPLSQEEAERMVARLKFPVNFSKINIR